MNFRPRLQEEPEINLIPFIDVLLVILIFLMLSTTYSKYTEMQLTLPVADTDPQRQNPRELVVSVASDGRYMVAGELLAGRSAEVLATALRGAAKGPETVLIISADATASHQAVVTVMEAARRAGLTQITFASQSSASNGAK